MSGATKDEKKDERKPSPETLARNWDELMQEIRVTQTGTQILTGFLLTVPFSSRFGELTAFQRWVYLAVLGGSVLTTCLVVAPVAFHRLLFRQRQRHLLVEMGNRFAIAGLVLLALTIAGVVLLVTDIVVGGPVASVGAGVVTFVVFALTWLVAPPGVRRLSRHQRNELPEDEEESG